MATLTFWFSLSSADGHHRHFNSHQFGDRFWKIRDKIGTGNGIGTRKPPRFSTMMGLQIIYCPKTRGRDGMGEIRAGALCEMAYLILKRRKFCRAKKEKKKNNARILKNNKKTPLNPARISPDRDTETKNKKYGNDAKTCRLITILAERRTDGMGNLQRRRNI